MQRKICIFPVAAVAKYFPLLREVVQLALVVCDLLFLQIHPFHLLSQDRLQSLEHYPKKIYARVRLPGGSKGSPEAQLGTFSSVQCFGEGCSLAFGQEL